MPEIRCPHCRHSNPLGARTCERCQAPLSARVQKRAAKGHLLASLSNIEVGQAAPFILTGLVLSGVIGLHLSASAWQGLLLHWGLLGLVAVGVTFPLLKGHYDFSVGPVAGLAACSATLAAWSGFWPGIIAGLATGCLAGLLNGLLVGWTSIPSTIVTIVIGAVALHLTIYAAGHADLTVTEPTLQALGETTFLGLPVAVALLACRQCAKSS